MAASAATAGLLRLGGDVQIPIPDDWLIGSGDLELPCQLIYAGGGAEIRIFETMIAGGETIDNEASLRQAVKDVITEVIMTLPEARLITSTGLYETHRAGFVLEFSSADSASGLPLKHRLLCLLYSHPEGHQLLFTVWGKAAADLYVDIAPSIKLVQDEFVYVGEYESEVFRSNTVSVWPPALVLMMAVGLLLLVRSMRQRQQLPKQTDEHGSWRCLCGRLNGPNVAICHRCEQERPSDEIT
ncbi:MAG: hypothetical protein DRP45_05805 [Candidatus Zixiibacteriota bacterium]|nr:MAG: hypothetical protein DRP45_05805 [candidate division Zixibacteria bacterium]